MIPHVAPPFWPETRAGRLAGAIYKNSAELLERPEALREAAGKCRVGLIGLADDTGVEMNHGRVGAKEGPHAFRRALARYGMAIPMGESAGGGKHAAYPHVFDAGDIIPGADIHETHDRVSAAVEAIVGLGLLPVGIGGGHDLTYPLVRGVARSAPVTRLGAAPSRGTPMTGVYLDAHLDVRPEAGSGMPFRRLLEENIASRLTCIGVNPMVTSEEHLAWFTSHGGSVERFAAEQWPGVPSGEEQFVSLDLDVLDAAYAPGVSAMNPCGMAPGEVAAYVRAAGRSPGVACFDIMELNPRHDQDGRTARLAAHMFLEFLRGLAERGEEGGR